MKMLDHALRYAGLGWRVFPLVPNQKFPFKGSNGFTDATTDGDVITRWWTQHRHANIGTPTAKICVVDCDRHEGGDDGIAQFEKLQHAHSIVPGGPVSKTGGGGLQYFFRCPAGLRACKLDTAIDLKANGGHVVLPPSIHPNGEGYSWDVDPEEIELPELPVWVIEHVNGNGPKPVSGDSDEDCILEGERNVRLASLAGKMRWAGFSFEEIAAALEIANENRCRPPLTTTEVRKIAKSIWGYPPKDANGEPATTLTADSDSIRGALVNILSNADLKPIEKNTDCAKAVIDHLLLRGRFYYDQQSKEHSKTMFFDNKRRLLLQVSSDAFISWLALHIRINRVQHTFKYIRSATEDESLAGKTQGIIPDEYFTMRDDKIYLSNGDGRMVRISWDEIKLVDNGTDNVLFAAGCTLDPWNLTEPRNPFEVCRAFHGISTGERDNHALDLLVAWALSLPTEQRCKPPLVVTGPVGSGKTRLIASVLQLYGMPLRILTPTKNGEDDFWTSVNAGGVLCMDNVDIRHAWLPDALAMAATDGSKEKRKLYTDSDRVMQTARSWITLTSANPTFASDTGLADRVLVVRLQRRTGETAEHELTDEIKGCRDAGLSWICEMLRTALCDHQAVPPYLNKRHPDFAVFAVRIGRAMGRGQEMIQTLTRAESDKHLFNLENSPVGEALLATITKEKPFKGDAASLLIRLETHNSDFGNEHRWNPRKLGKVLSTMWPHVEVVFQADITKHGGKNVYKLSVRPAQSEVDST